MTNSAPHEPEPASGLPPYVDWDFAATTGSRLVSAGPSITAAEAAEAVAGLRRAADRAREPVAETARLSAPGEAPPARVVDRPTWIALNAASMGALMEPVFTAVMEQRDGRETPVTSPLTAVGGKVTGAEAGALLAFMATKVLGQYDLAPGGEPALLLVAPNVVRAEQELEVDPTDFRAWVCMHEETHRVQFTAVPWLREHLVSRAQDLAVSMAPGPREFAEKIQQAMHRLPEALSEGGGGLTDLFTTQEQRDELARLTAVMSLLEGHADVVMDDVGPAHIPSVAEIRAKFTKRRQGVGAADRLLRRLLGLEAKLRQYRDGARFVRTVQDTVGVDGFNVVWTSPETLPRPTEITDPPTWVARVHG